jgi:hypothetical protein
MQYYLVDLIYKPDKWTKVTVQHLVKASDKEKAKEAFAKTAVEKGIAVDSIVDIKIYDTIIGE